MGVFTLYISRGRRLRLKEERPFPRSPSECPLDSGVEWVPRPWEERGKAEPWAAHGLSLFPPCDNQSRVEKVLTERNGVRVENWPQLPTTAMSLRLCRKTRT